MARKSLEEIRHEAEGKAYEKFRKESWKHVSKPMDFKKSYYNALMATADAQVAEVEARRAVKAARKAKPKKK